MEVIKLTSEQVNKVRKAIHEGGSLLRNECNCGDWEVRLKGLGYFRLSVYCRKSNHCPSDKIWCLDSMAYIYPKSRLDCDLEEEPIYELDKSQVEEIQKVAKMFLYEEFECDEYGGDFCYQTKLEYLLDYYECEDVVDLYKVCVLDLDTINLDTEATTEFIAALTAINSTEDEYIQTQLIEMYEDDLLF